MTVVIGIMCRSKQSTDPTIPTKSDIFLCADTLATYAAPQQTPVTSHPSQGKIYALPHGFFAAFCDDYSWSHQIACELHSRMLNADFKSDAVRDLLKVEVQAAFRYAFTWFREEVLKDEVGITAEEYLYDKKLRRSFRRKADAILQGRSGDLPAELVIAGQTHRGPMLLKANARSISETTEFHVSGSPQESVISWLRFRDQRSNMSAARSFYHMIEAKRFAQIDPTVGQKTQILYIRPSEEPALFADDGISTMKAWRDIFGIKSTEELDSDKARLSFEKEAIKKAQTIK
jgi:hypothetical protein